MKKRNLLFPSVLMLLISAGAMWIYDIMANRVLDNFTPEWKEVPEYTYLSPYIELSPYDQYFRQAADSLGYDWTLLAAIAFTESRFDSTAISNVGARGVMQVMPLTYRGFNIPDSLHEDSYTNIMAATMLLRSLEQGFQNISDREERLKFVLASYNAGVGHVNDAIRLANKYGYKKHVWEANVDSFLIHKNHPKYYRDEACHNGRFRGWRETLSFVKKVHKNWRNFSSVQQNYRDSIRLLIVSDNTIRILE